jgi:hypothetical protein
MRSRGSVRSGNDRLVRSEPFELFNRPQRSLPVRVAGLLVRLRAELLVLALVLGLGVSAWLWLSHRLPVWQAAVALATPAILLGIGIGCWGTARRYVVRRVWAVLTRHRLRKVFVECRIMNFSGALPLLLWARPTPVGERVWVGLRAGIDLREIELRLSHIASGCLATDARVAPHRWTAALVVIDVIRRDPLTGPAVASPVATSTAGKPQERSPLRLVPTLGGERRA